MAPYVKFEMKRRDVIRYLSAIGSLAILESGVAEDPKKKEDNQEADVLEDDIGPYSEDLLPKGVRSRFVSDCFCTPTDEPLRAPAELLEVITQ